LPVPLQFEAKTKAFKHDLARCGKLKLYINYRLEDKRLLQVSADGSGILGEGDSPRL